MEGHPTGYISTSCMDMKSMVALHEHSAFILLNEVVRNLISDMGLSGKVKCGCIVHLTARGGYMVKTKVIVPRNDFFFHEEPWSEFPSDHFKTKLLLVTGGA